jgi:glycosyltransferase involved in cell wall biosynthesis
VRIALVHDYLTQYGGAERVLDVLKAMFPDAPVYTSVLDYSELPDHYRTWDIRTSFMAKLPGHARYHRALLPLYPPAFRSFRRELSEFDVVLADSSAWSHQAQGRGTTINICYCHSPARFLYHDENYLAPAIVPRPLKPLLPPVLAGLRKVDRASSSGVDHFIANSNTVAARIRRAYQRDAEVIYPPVDTQRYAAPEPEVRGDYFLVVSRLVPHKRIDLSVIAASRSGVPLKVVGTGRAREQLEALAGPTVAFLGRQDDESVIDLMQHARAFILPGAEDFGMTAVEAQAAGTPVIAYGVGGALESVVDGETGLFFNEPSPESLQAALERFAHVSWNREHIRTNAARFGQDAFKRAMTDFIERALEKR